MQVNGYNTTKVKKSVPIKKEQEMRKNWVIHLSYLAIISSVMCSSTPGMGAVRRPKAVVSIVFNFNTGEQTPRSSEGFAVELKSRIEMQDIAVMKIEDKLTGLNFVDPSEEKRLKKLLEGKGTKLRLYLADIDIVIAARKKADARGVMRVTATASVKIKDGETRRPTDSFRTTSQGKAPNVTVAKDSALRTLAQSIADKLADSVLPKYGRDVAPPLPEKEEPKPLTPIERYEKTVPMDIIYLAIRGIEEPELQDFLRILTSNRYDPMNLINRIRPRPARGRYVRMQVETQYTPEELLNLIRNMREFRFRDPRVERDTVYLTFDRERPHGFID
jgi:hypothetical protein